MHGDAWTGYGALPLDSGWERAWVGSIEVKPSASKRLWIPLNTRGKCVWGSATQDKRKLRDERDTALARMFVPLMKLSRRRSHLQTAPFVELLLDFRIHFGWGLKIKSCLTWENLLFSSSGAQDEPGVCTCPGSDLHKVRISWRISLVLRNHSHVVLNGFSLAGKIWLF